MNNSQYSVEVIVNGRPVKEYQHYINGEYKTFIEGRSGTEYSLKITNNSNQKLLGISSVDGLNVVSGQTSDGYKGRGYIIQPNTNVIIKGFRQSDDVVGAFKFVSKGNSYASSKGFEKNCGIIAVNLINEKIEPVVVNVINNSEGSDAWWNQPIGSSCLSSSNSLMYNGSSTTTGTNSDIHYTCGDLSRSNISQFGQSGAINKKAPNFDLGTGWGNKVEDKITRKSFEKGNIVSNFRIFYASRAALESMGIKFHIEKQIDWPEGFQGDYCKSPKGWN